MRGDVRDVYTACHEPCPPHPQFEPFVLQGTGSWRVTCRSGEWTALNGPTGRPGALTSKLYHAGNDSLGRQIRLLLLGGTYPSWVYVGALSTYFEAWLAHLAQYSTPLSKAGRRIRVAKADQA
ncbi:uncharacterized protein LAJ45_10475 [Morchella importuna]|uniref:uncharacterized protein n=1 Tax=Morchella importuna TaxID=1174673 RepID=UPI001E8E6CCF|nr:uncharacterized protein LAJ45_10475 [Morchella importuna]KAH8145505.1 hypothetical protein LAJ45_10475 [Morchella importuna]